ncbi:helix-turn-helix transcriptional regulator [Shewanella eurypsychrophilus]|uniref:Helix-turn-helix transcriptional regulator n=1 Tax=Shewanella eurypsychrophilus TaxID=2593656 RepID=A0ABX6V0I2_9GAMM|nr:MULTISPECIES: helix-turn-helix transcriptional regulator [Shewanella]QFU20561.1 helix-turn-helix domain-containing protein [Shewanella sp. YLB-09]QFU20842.1 helix-turn-helix domain-containing protein [Shewanella sp. YLB-09]QPG56130.1 helix-turn-helix transcriptional regulator [Shewanella eurypsychrophilus]
MQLMTILLLISVGLTFFMMGYVATTPYQNRKARLCFTMMLIGLVSLMLELAIFEEGASYLYIISISGPLSVSVPIFFYLYFKASMRLNDEFQWQNIMHLIFPLLYILAMMPYNLLDEASKQWFFSRIYTHEPIPWQLSFMPIRFTRLLLMSGLGSIYLYLSWRELHIEINNKKSDVLREMGRLKGGFIAISISFAIVFSFFIFRLPHQFTWMISTIVLVVTAMSSMIFYYLPVLGKKLTSHKLFYDLVPEITADTADNIAVSEQLFHKQYRSSVTSTQAKQVITNLTQLMEDGIYKDSKLSLSKLASQLQTSTHHLSQIINQQTQGNYFDLINEYRIKHAKQLLIDGKMSVIDIAYEVGYNSKSSFYTEFKRRTETTPHKFKKSQTH